MKRLTISVWVFFIIFFKTISLDAAANTTTPEANYLNAIGIFRGTAEGYELDRKLTRLQGAVMIVRLLGEETAAIEANEGHPFTDVPSWGDPYVAYMYKHKLTQGRSETYYGADEWMLENDYVTFVLRALGYDDQAGDFHWQNALLKAKEINMIKPYRQGNGDDFVRDDMVDYTYLGLQTLMKNSGKTLEDHLADKGAFPPILDTAKLIYSYENSTYMKAPSTVEQLISNMERMIYFVDGEESFDLSHLEPFELTPAIEKAIDNISKVPGYSSMLTSYKMNLFGNDLKVEMFFNNTLAEMRQARSFGKKAVQSLIDPKMSDFEKELAIHDFLVDRIDYDTARAVRPSSYTIYGALIEGSAVCHGYAESFQLLGYLAGIKTEIVFGQGLSNGKNISHAWNMVSIEGETYHVDTTWDDPVMSDGSHVLSYSYFNLTDEALVKDHTWKQQAYEVCDSDKYNYFIYNRQIVYGRDELRTYIQKGIDEDIDRFSVKMIGNSLSEKDIQVILQNCYGYGKIVYRIDSLNNIVTIEQIG